jgi:phosphate transport system permease protein
MNRLFEKIVIAWCWLSTFLLIAAVGVVIGFLLIKGAPALNQEIILGDTAPLDALLLRRAVFGGLFPAIIGTILLVGMAIIIAAPVGILTGIYMAEYASLSVKNRFGFFFDILAGLPSIVMGLFGLAVVIFLHKYVSTRVYPCLFLSALTLAFLVLPYLIRSTQGALEALPVAIRRTAPALGASRIQNLFLILLPRARDGILNGVILSIGRCAEDTAVIMLTGAVAVAGVPRSVFENYEALPFYIYYISSQYADQQELLSGYAAAIVLLCLCSLLFASALYVNHRFHRGALYRL